MDTKKLVLSSIAVGAAGAAVFTDKNKRNHLLLKVRSFRNKWFGEQEELPIDEAGQPEPNDIENNKMLDEGSVYGVHYYNRMKQEA